jgi:Putative prokaryotic signal transducing protein
MDEQPELVTIEKFKDTAEAEMAKGRLRSAGIDSFLVGENAGVLYGNSIGSMQLQVNPEDEADARAVLESIVAPGEAERAEEQDAIENPIDRA